MERKKKQSTIDIYWRKLGFFVLVFSLIIVSWRLYNTRRFFADEQLARVSSSYTTSAAVTLDVRDDGSVYKDNNKITSRVLHEREFDELRLIVFDKNGYYLDNLKITLNLPGAVAKESKPEILAIHGVEFSEARIIDDTTVLYQASQVGEDATITVVARIPKGVIKLSFYDQLILFLSSFGGSIWLVAAIVVPILTVLYMLLLLSMHQKAQKVERPDREIVAPPAALPPAVTGVLLSQKIGPREIAATLIDLALRGYIFIIDRDRGFAFGKRNFSGHLLPFEKLLLAKIFSNEIKISEQEVTDRFANHLYSHKMSIFTQEVYSLATGLGYFKVNPVKVHRKYQFVGTVLFFFALSCFFLSFKYFPSVPYAAFLWIGMMVSSIIIVIIGSKMPIRTVLGRQALSNWLAFRKYLSSSKPLKYKQSNYDQLIHYLPYAIIFHCEALWVKRFGDQEFVTPDWFLSDKDNLSLEDFCLALFPIIGYVGQNLATIREPGYK